MLSCLWFRHGSLQPARSLSAVCVMGAPQSPWCPPGAPPGLPLPPTLTPNPSLLHCTTHSDSDSPLPYKTPHVEMAQCYSQPGQMVDSLLGAFICPLSSTPALELTEVTHLARSLGESLPHGHHDPNRHHDPTGHIWTQSTRLSQRCHLQPQLPPALLVPTAQLWSPPHCSPC